MDQINEEESREMAMKNLILLVAVVFSGSLLAQEMTHEEKATAVKEFCLGLDINGKVINASRADLIKKICGDKANAENIMCRWYSIDTDGNVAISENKIEDIRLVCKQFLAKADPDREVKQETSFWSFFAGVPHGR